MLRRILGSGLLCFGVVQGATAYPLKYYSPEVDCHTATASLIARDGCSRLPLAPFAVPEEPPVADELPAPSPVAAVVDPAVPAPAQAPPGAIPQVEEVARAPSRGGFVAVDWRAWQLHKWLDSIRRSLAAAPTPGAPTHGGGQADAGAPGGGLPTAPPYRGGTLPGDDTGGIITGILDPAPTDIPGGDGLAGRQPATVDGDDGATPTAQPPSGAGAPPPPLAVVEVGEAASPTAMPLPASSLLLATGLVALTRCRRRNSPH